MECSAGLVFFMQEVMRLKKTSQTTDLVLALFLYIPVIWAALLIAQSLGGGLPELLSNLTAALEQPFQIHWTDKSLLSILVCTGAYLMGLCLYASGQGRTRDGEEHGSAAWGSPRQLNAQFRQKQNKILTRHVRLGLDTHKHRRSLNVLVIGGSGAAKTRGYDELDMDNAGSAAMISNWRDVLAVYAVRTTTDNASPDEVATLTEEKMEILREIFWDMNAISYHLETVSGGEDEGDTVILRITVTVKDHLQMADEYRFNADQRKLLEELMQPEYQELFAALTGSYQDIELSPDEVAKIMENLPADLSEARREVVLTAYQLLGRVHYFWGGKSLVIGWDSRWGMPMEVTAEGSSTTGTVRPFGLDCSGMVDWVFYNQSGGQYVIGHGGGATAQHSYCAPIAWGDAQPGDLVFYPGDSHVGIVCGFDSSGNIMVIHCASSENNVVVTGKSGFTSIGRPEYFAD